MTRPQTAIMRQCADAHRTLANIYRLDVTHDGEVTAQASLLTALMLEAAADFIDSIPTEVPDAVTA